MTFISRMPSIGGALSCVCWCPSANPKAAPSKKFSVAMVWPPLIRELNWLPLNMGSPFGAMGV